MCRVFACVTLSFVGVIAGCSDPFAVKIEPTGTELCLNKLKSDSIKNWVGRTARRQDKGTLSLTYGVDLPFDDAKQLENALAQLPGNSQDVRFYAKGRVHVVIAGGTPPFEYTASANNNGKMGMAKKLAVTETLCRAVNKAGGSLTDISVHTADYSFDDGKVHQQPVP